MTEDELARPWCIWSIRVTEENKDVINKWKLNKKPNSSPAKVGWLVMSDGYYNDSRLYDETEITFEQFKKHVLKQNDMKTDKGFPFELNPKDAKRIMKSACPDWKETLAKRWGVAIVLDKSITVEKDFYEIMRSACTKDQHKLFDEIFGKDVKETYNIGDRFRDRDAGYEYILAATNTGKINLINLSNGGRWGYEVSVKDIDLITQEEFYTLTEDEHFFTKINK